MEKMTRAISFCDAWVSLILRCVSSVMYSVILNGAQGEKFCPSCGLR